MSIGLIILGLVLFVCLVLVHEWGHFIMARRNGVDVEEYGLGFPPRAWGKKLKSGMLLSINWLPLGGFVKLKGEHDADTEPGSYGAASLWAKTKIIAAGVVMNLVVAIAIFTFLAIVGMPKLFDNQFTVKSDTKLLKNEVLVADVESGSPAAKVNLQPRDQILAIGRPGQTLTLVATVDQLPKITKQYAGQNVEIQYKQDGQTKVASATLRSSQDVEASQKTDNPKGYLGIVPTEYTLQRSTWSAPIKAVGVTGQFTALTFKGLWTAVSSLFQGHANQASQQVSGPVGIFVIIKDGSLLGYQFILMIIAVISMTLAIMNILPIPALDGGRLFVMYLFRGLKKPLDAKTEERIHGTGFALLMILFILITFVDIRRFF